MLVSRLLKSVNSAFHNRAGIEIVDLGLAISRLGFEAVRNTAITLAVEQIFDASKHESLTERLGELWRNSINLSAMSYVLAERSNGLNSDSAFLCGLLNGVGQLYILTRARDFPSLLGDNDSLETVLNQWSPTVGKSIVEAWGFPDEITATLDVGDAEADAGGANLSLTDVMAATKLLVSDAENALASSSRTVVGRFGINEENWPEIAAPYEMCVQSMRQSLSG